MCGRASAFAGRHTALWLSERSRRRGARNMPEEELNVNFSLATLWCKERDCTCTFYWLRLIWTDRDWIILFALHWSKTFLEFCFEMLRWAILLQALCTMLSRLVLRFLGLTDLSVAWTHPAIQMTVKAFQILPPIYKIITFNDNYHTFPIICCYPTCSSALCSGVMISRALTTNQLHLLSWMSVPIFPVNAGSP